MWRNLRRGLTVASLAAVMLLPTACVEQPIQVTVTLQGVGDVDFDAIECLKVIVRTEDPMPSVFGPFERSEDTQTRLGATVAPGESFTVDVQGCPAFDAGTGEKCPREACTPESILADGCWGPGTIESEEETINIQLGPPEETGACFAPGSEP